MMKKRLLSIFTSVSLIASALSAGVFAAPSAVTIIDSAISYTAPETPAENTAVNTGSLLFTEGPSPITVFESAKETNTKFGVPSISEGAYLFSELVGEGTKESPFLIGTSDELFTMAENINSGIHADACYKLTGDIDLGGAEWTPVGYVSGSGSIIDYSKSFSGVFDGDGFAIKNFKITKDTTAYIGLFGFVYGGSIKNLTLDGVNISFASQSAERLYVSPLAGRIVCDEENMVSKIENCHVINTNVDVSSLGMLYAGGLMGGATAGDVKGAEIFVAFSDTDCVLNVSTTSTTTSQQVATAGGIAGYFGAQTGAKLTAINCHSNSTVKANVPDLKVGDNLAIAMSGGVFGNLRTQEENIALAGGEMYISSCYSTGDVVAIADFNQYIAGGFAAQVLPTKLTKITDCYSSSDVTGKFNNYGYSYYQGPYEFQIDPVAGGFIGQIFYYLFTDAYGKDIVNCYASGDVIDLVHNENSAKDTSYVGGFVAYSDASTYLNCFRLESQERRGSDTCEDDYFDILLLSDEQSLISESYTGYDFENVWQMNPDADYPYPELKEKSGYVTFINEGSTYSLASFGEDGKLSAPAATPSKGATVDKVFTFNYWSLSENGSPFNFAVDTVDENTSFYAVYTSAPRQYTLKFISEGKSFVEDKKLDYGSSVKAPTSIPSKSDNDKYFYKFLYWSDSENGGEFDFSDVKLFSNMTFYAVFDEIDKSAWTGGVADSFSAGFGSQELPYVITTGDELALFAKLINEGDDEYYDAYYELGADIHLGNNMWVPIGNSTENYFGGHFDGKGYTIKNFKVVEGQYAGLFGVVRNATIKNLHVKDFDISFTITNKNDYYPAFAGALAGYITSNRGTSEISGIRVSGGKIDWKANVGYAYAGNIAGYASASLSSRTYIRECFATTPVTVDNSFGYNCAGGLVGQLSTGSGSLALIERCYNTGNVKSTANLHSSKAGGLVGYLHSYGSAYSPTPGSSSLFDPTFVNKETDGMLSADAVDIDVMLKDSFAVASVYSKSVVYDSCAGRLIGEANTYAAMENCFYPRSSGVVVEAPHTDPNYSKINTEGYSTSLANLQNAGSLSSNLGFDFDKTWAFVSDSVYPVLRCMISDKPTLAVTSAVLDNGVLSASVRVLSEADSYIVVIGVYTDRNQLIKFERKRFANTEFTSDFDVVYDGMAKADYIVISAVESNSLKPLFEDLKYEI